MGPVTREFDATVTEQHPDERVAWKSDSGPDHAGVVTFHRLDDNSTRVTTQLDVDPDGVVRIRDALWRARTNRATPIHAGERVRVVSIEGVVLEVEPETGGARDHRERRRGS